MCVLVAQSCPTLCDPMNYSPLGSSSLGDLPNPGIEWTQVSHIAGGFFTIWITKEAHSIVIVLDKSPLANSLKK